MLLRRHSYAQGEVIKIKWDVGTLIEWYNPNPILDIPSYEVKLGGGEVTELTEKVVSEPMAQCDIDGNE